MNYDQLQKSEIVRLHPPAWRQYPGSDENWHQADEDWKIEEVNRKAKSIELLNLRSQVRVRLFADTIYGIDRDPNGPNPDEKRYFLKIGMKVLLYSDNATKVVPFMPVEKSKGESFPPAIKMFREAEPELSSGNVVPAQRLRVGATSPSIHDYFVTDFQLPALFGTGAFGSPASATSPAKPSVNVEYRHWFDADSHASFLAMYIPSAPQTFEMLKNLVETEGYKEFLKARSGKLQLPGVPKKGEQVYVEPGNDGNVARIVIKRPADAFIEALEMKFSGAIYLYLDDRLTPYEVGLLDVLYRTKGLFPQFRGPDYREMRQLADNNVADSSPPKQGSESSPTQRESSTIAPPSPRAASTNSAVPPSWSPGKSLVLGAIATIVATVIGGVALSYLKKSDGPQLGSSVTNNTSTGTIDVAPGAPVIGREAPVPGTTWTHSELLNNFPFGYVIISQPAGGRWTYEPYPGDHIKWTADWAKMNIEVNHSTNKVYWTFPPDMTISRNGKVVWEQKDCHITFDTPFQEGGVYEPMLAVFPGYDEPAPVVTTLSSNQRAPVFVVGFKIWPKRDPQR